MTEIPIVVAERRGVKVMPAPDGGDYTPHLIAALKQLTTDDEQLDLYFTPGLYAFEGPLDTTSEPEIWDSFRMFATQTAPTRQHRLEGNSNARRRAVQFNIDMDDEDDIWMDIDRDYRFGPIAITGNIALTLVNKGSLLSFGDFTRTEGVVPTMRGLCLQCDLDRVKHFASGDSGDGRSWLINAGADGYVRNRTNNSFGVRMTACYDVRLDLDMWGLKNGVINSHCDSPQGFLKGLSCGRTLLEPSSVSVASRWTTIWEENCLLGSVIRGHVGDFRGEVNETTSVPSPGAYALPATVNWSITAGGSTIVFTSWDGDYDALDYFEAEDLILVTPSESGEPPRPLRVTAVTANTVTFAESAGRCYVGRDITGTGTGITRYLGVPGTLYGVRGDIAQLSSVSNISGLPFFAVAPGISPIRVAGNSCGRGIGANDPQPFLIVASCAGAQEQAIGDVNIIGTASYVDHPAVTKPHLAPKVFDRRTRDVAEYSYNPATGVSTFIAEPGHGVSTINDCSLKLTYHPLTRFGQTVWAYRPSDNSTTGWQVRDHRLQAGVATTVRALVYSEAGATVSVYGGGGSSETDSAGVGWDVVSVELETSQVVADGNGPYIRLNGSGYYVARVWIEQSA